VIDPALPPLPITSFKLQLTERRARILPARDASGCPFAGPGVDLVGDDTAEAFALAAPLLQWLEAREPLRVRALSFDVARRQLLVTFNVPGRVLKVDPGLEPGAAAEVLILVTPLLGRLGEIAAVKVASRSNGEHP
jgi:hypothetical protein